MGFKATEAVEALTYDFSPHGPTGEIAEPSSAQIEAYRTAYFDVLKKSAELAGEAEKADADETKTLSQRLADVDLDALMEKNREAEQIIISATAALTGLDEVMLGNLPGRIKSAFLGWVVGVFLSPEG